VQIKSQNYRVGNQRNEQAISSLCGKFFCNKKITVTLYLCTCVHVPVQTVKMPPRADSVTCTLLNYMYMYTDTVYAFIMLKCTW